MALKTFIKTFEEPQRSAKIKIEVSFFSSSGVGTGRDNPQKKSLAKREHIKTSRKIEQDQESLIFSFYSFLTASVHIFISGGKTRH